MKSGVFFIVSALCACLAACDQTVAVQDGEIPAEYLDQATEYTGTYIGQLTLMAECVDTPCRVGVKDMNLTLSLQGNKASLSTSSDLIDEQCESKIGELRKVTVAVDPNHRTTKPVLMGARFAFDPNHCKSVIGRTVDISFGPGRAIALEVAKGLTPMFDGPTSYFNYGSFFRED